MTASSLLRRSRRRCAQWLAGVLVDGDRTGQSIAAPARGDGRGDGRGEGRGDADMQERPLGSGYFLELPLGEGASGQVWLGRDRAGRPRAVKLLRHELASDVGVVQRFVQERSVLESIHHPNVIAVHDLVVEGSTLAIVMDYVDGEDLASVLRERGPLPPAEVVELGRHVATALHAAHVRGVVHRDVKPANVVVETALGQARLGDFGIARIVDTAEHRTVLLGTPLYMAPEIIAGEEPTGAADVYSLGHLLYELLCGVPAFDGKPAQAALLAAHLSEDPGRPDGVPYRVWALLQRMVAKDPADRPSAATVADSLRSLAADCIDVPAAARLASPPATVAAADSPLGRSPSAIAGAADTLLASVPQATAAGWSPYPMPMSGSDRRTSQETSLGFGAGPARWPGAPYGRSPSGQVSYPVSGSGSVSVPRRRTRRGVVVAAVVVGLIAFGGGSVALGMKLAGSTSTAAGTGSTTVAATPLSSAASAAPGSATASPGRSTAPAVAPTTLVVELAPPNQREANALVLDYSDRLVSGSLRAADMPQFFTDPVVWYQVPTSRPGLHDQLATIDLVSYRNTYDPPRYTSFVAPTAYGGQPAALISYFVSYHKPGDSGTVKVTYTVVRGADGQSRIAAVSEQPA